MRIGGKENSLHECRKFLVPFSMIVNIEYLTLKFMHNRYSNSSNFNFGLLENHSTEFVIMNLITRETEDPLRLITPPDINTESLFEQIYERNAQAILENENIEFTNIYKLTDNALRVFDAEVTIWCTNQAEEDFVKRDLSEKYKTIVEPDIKKLDFNEHSVLMLDRLSKLNEIKEIAAGCSIYLAKTNYNLHYDEENQQVYLDEEFLLELIEFFKISIFIIDLYELSEDYFIGG